MLLALLRELALKETRLWRLVHVLYSAHGARVDECGELVVGDLDLVSVVLN